MGVNEGNERGCEVSEGSVNVSGWEYSFSEDLLIRYGCGLGEDVSSVECVELKASREFVHSEVLYGMEW